MSANPIHSAISILLVFILISCNNKPAAEDYLTQKAHFKSNLIVKEKAPQEYQELETNKNVIKIEYPSNGLMLKGLLSRKNLDSTTRKPILVYLHGGFALGEQDMRDCEYFAQKGYVVFTPSYRGENGNAGFFELFMGEVDDAKAAIKWIAKQPFADSTKIYVFGHSIGGGISAMLSLEKDVPIAFSGSSGGLYSKNFYGWDDIIPFDKNNPLEIKMRVLIENIPSMQINHYAFIGKEDTFLYAMKDEVASRSKDSKLKVYYIPGDHWESLAFAMERFVDIITLSK